MELLGDKDNRWDGTVGQASEKWTVKEWRKVYGFGRGGEGMASRTDRFIDGMFSGRVNPKDGYAVVDCRDPRVKRVLEFLVPLLYPEKPTRVTITVGNTIFGALSGERPVDWGIVVKDLVQRLLSGNSHCRGNNIGEFLVVLDLPASPSGLDALPLSLRYVVTPKPKKTQNIPLKPLKDYKSDLGCHSVEIL